VTIPDAIVMEGPALQSAARSAYGLVRERLAGSGKQPVRFWNHIPNLLRSAGDGRDRYMAFNAGRYAAFKEWFGPANLDSVATASGVGHRGADLVVHCLALPRAGSTVGNPRQVPPAHYSARYGSVPPCFARATRVYFDSDPRRPILLVGGTAAVRGEDSTHPGDLAGQLRETFVNLAAVLAGKDIAESDPLYPWLAAYREIRVYYPRPHDRQEITTAIRRNLPKVRRIEAINVDLCRRELLVEIEGLADGSARRSE
jgi:hypothetical protein